MSGRFTEYQFSLPNFLAAVVREKWFFFEFVELAKSVAVKTRLTLSPLCEKRIKRSSCKYLLLNCWPGGVVYARETMFLAMFRRKYPPQIDGTGPFDTCVYTPLRYITLNHKCHTTFIHAFARRCFQRETTFSYTADYVCRPAALVKISLIDFVATGSGFIIQFFILHDLQEILSDWDSWKTTVRQVIVLRRDNKDATNNSQYYWGFFHIS